MRAGDVEAAKAAFAPSRQAWERIEPIAGLVSDIDGAVDARVDDFADEDDPAWTGWHKLEYLIWETGDLSEAGPIADQLDADLADAAGRRRRRWRSRRSSCPSGSAELIEEVSAGKITGEEDRYSHTDLWDFAANVEGSQAGLRVPRGRRSRRPTPSWRRRSRRASPTSRSSSRRTRDGDGYLSYEELTEEDKTAMQATLAELSEQLSQVAGVLGLQLAT